MPATELTKQDQDGQATLVWENAPRTWPAHIQRLYSNAAENPVGDHWGQGDVDMLYLVCDEFASYTRYKKDSGENNAALFRELMGRLDKMGLSLFGRVQTAVMINTGKSEKLADNRIQEVAASIRTVDREPLDYTEDDDDVEEAEVVDE